MLRQEYDPWLTAARLYDLEVEEEKTGASRRRTVVAVRNKLHDQEQALAGPGPSTDEHRRKADEAASSSWTNWNGVAYLGGGAAADQGDAGPVGQDADDAADSMDEDEPAEPALNGVSEPSARLYNRRRQYSRVDGDGLYEIIDEVTETRKSSQAIQTVDQDGNIVSWPVNLDVKHMSGDGMDIDEDGEDVQITVTRQAQPRPLWRTRSASTSSSSSTESEWMEVDDLLGGPDLSPINAGQHDSPPNGPHSVLRIMTDKVLVANALCASWTRVKRLATWTVHPPFPISTLCMRLLRRLQNLPSDMPWVPPMT